MKPTTLTMWMARDAEIEDEEMDQKTILFLKEPVLQDGYFENTDRSKEPMENTIFIGGFKHGLRPGQCKKVKVTIEEYVKNWNKENAPCQK